MSGRVRQHNRHSSDQMTRCSRAIGVRRLLGWLSWRREQVARRFQRTVSQGSFRRELGFIRFGGAPATGRDKKSRPCALVANYLANIGLQFAERRDSHALPLAANAIRQAVSPTLPIRNPIDTTSELDPLICPMSGGLNAPRQIGTRTSLERGSPPPRARFFCCPGRQAPNHLRRR